MSKLDNVWGFTHFNIKKSSYLWTIKNYSCNAVKPGKKFESPIFSLDSDSNSDNKEKYCLAVWPKGVTGSSPDDYIAMSFCNKNSYAIDVDFSISIIDEKGNKFKEHRKRNTINDFDGFNKFLKQSELNETNGLLVNDIVTFSCEYTIIVGGSSSSAISIYPSPGLKTKTLDAFEQQLDVKEFSDFTLIAPCGKKLFVHKFILAARSPVFSAMFKNDMKEKANDAVNIEDINYDVLKEMLRFMYAAKVENLDNIVYELVAAADKYQIDGLKELCEEYFFKNLRSENMKEILDVSHQYNLENVKQRIHLFLLCHSKSFFDTVGFESNESMKVLADAFSKKRKLE